jgi:hypothetical protein
MLILRMINVSHDPTSEVADKDYFVKQVMNQIRYKMIKYTGDQLRDDWIEQEYHWIRRNVGTGCC